MIDYVVYGDTDSVAGKSIIVTDQGDIPISDLWNISIEKSHDKKDYGLLPGIKALTFGNKSPVFKNINYIMRHKTSKKMFLIRYRDIMVEVTEDHSIMVERNGFLLEVKPGDIIKKDKIIILEPSVYKFHIKKIEDFDIIPLGVKDQYVYDIETEDNHNFFANGVLVHNSLYININNFILDNIKNGDNWTLLSDEEKIKYVMEISKIIEDHVNDKTYNETQLIDYNSQVKDLKITFEQEKIAKTALFIKKKKYAVWCVNEEGISVDKISVTGLEVVRSDSSQIIREKLKNILEMIMKSKSDKELMDIIDKNKKELKDIYPEEIAANIGVNGIDKYIIDGKSIKGTPWHVKGVANYRRLLRELKIEDKYEDIYESIKAKVVYVKKNPFDIETITFHRWPKEFDKILEVDHETMVSKFFLKKIGFLLEPIGKINLIETSQKREEVLNSFFI